MTDQDAAARTEAERRARELDKKQAEAMRRNREDWRLNHPAPELRPVGADDSNSVAAEADRQRSRAAAGEW